MALTDPNALTYPIALAGHDELPETWDKLLESPNFGEDALERRLNVLMWRAFGEVLDGAEQALLDPVLVSYLGKRLALDLIIPGIDYWSKQVLSHSAGERETKAYKDRAEDLKELRKLLIDETAKMLSDVDQLLPLIPRPAADTPKVLEAGFSTLHVTADPMGFPPMYGPPEETTTG
jgi:hypothetical protein